MRPIGIATIIDRAVQQLICLVLELLVELTSDFNSFGFYHKQKCLCFVCKKPFNEQEFFNNNLHIHHIIPISKGGSLSSEKNLALVHPLCHKSIDH